MNHKPLILIADDDNDWRTALADDLEVSGKYAVLQARDGNEAVRQAVSHPDISCILLDYNMPGRNGLEVMEALELEPAPVSLIPIIMMSTAMENRGKLAVTAVRKGAVEFVDLGCSPSLIQETLDRLLGHSVASASGAQKLFAACGFASSGEAMAEVCMQAVQAARLGWNVLILGETGTGKSQLAKAIHKVRTSGVLDPAWDSSASMQRFEHVNCAAIPSTLFESELFGHVKGAFTGADEDKDGCLEVAADGTLFLDEIAEIPNDAQAKLNLAIDEKKFKKVGDHTREYDLRATIIAATLHEELLRKDLHRRFVDVIRIPPLRERPEDIPPLITQFKSRYAEKYTIPELQIDPMTVSLLQKQPWAGNAGQLDNVVHRAVARAWTDNRTMVSAADIAAELRIEYSLSTWDSPDSDDLSSLLDRLAVKAVEQHTGNIPAFLEQVRKRFIEEVLRNADGNIKQAERLWGYSEGGHGGLAYWMKKLGVEKEALR
jgi:DNA-binding NtrC family response regulator